MRLTCIALALAVFLPVTARCATINDLLASISASVESLKTDPNYESEYQRLAIDRSGAQKQIKAFMRELVPLAAKLQSMPAGSPEAGDYRANAAGSAERQEASSRLIHLVNLCMLQLQKVAQHGKVRLVGQPLPNSEPSFFALMGMGSFIFVTSGLHEQLNAFQKMLPHPLYEAFVPAWIVGYMIGVVVLTRALYFKKVPEDPWSRLSFLVNAVAKRQNATKLKEEDDQTDWMTKLFLAAASNDALTCAQMLSKPEPGRYRIEDIKTRIGLVSEEEAPVESDDASADADSDAGTTQLKTPQGGNAR